MRKCKYPEIRVGDKFGQLTVLAPAPKIIYRDGKSYWAWLCKCYCGAEVVIKDASLKGGQPTCGCWTPEAKQAARERATRHGEGANGRETTEYISWNSLNRRVSSPSMVGQVWQQNGIRVCQGWRVYENFLAKMGRKLTSKHTIDRIDNKGHYSCGECEECLKNGWPFNGRWATYAEQARNRSDNRMLTLRSQTLCVVDWEIEVGLYRGCIENRLTKGEPEDENLLRPASKWRKTG